MFEVVKNWVNTRLANAELLALILTLAIIIVLFHFFGEILAPVLVSLVFAYLLDGAVTRLVRWKIPRGLAAAMICLLFIGLLFLAFFIFIPLLWQQLANLVNEAPLFLNKSQQWFLELSRHYPQYISTEKITSLIANFQNELTQLGKLAVGFSLNTLFNLVTVIIYIIIVPFLLFFFLKDRDEILKWLGHFLPENRRLIGSVWGEVNFQISRYIRAKFLQMLIVGSIVGIIFAFFGLKYSILLAVLAGASTLIPYIGVTLASIPVIIVAYLQWGISPTFIYTMVAYGAVMLMDGNLLEPLLFSEALKIHPVAVIIAILFFGSIWGFWGIFFAIPLATVVKALINAWFESRNEKS